MKIAWLGPWNTHSAIGAFGGLIVEELVERGHEVDIYRSETGTYLNLPELPSRHSIRALSGTSPDILSQSYDVVLANLGDSFAMHGAILPYLRTTPLVLIIHDLFLANLAAGWAAVLPNGEVALRTMVHEAYGHAALVDGASYWTDLASMAAHRPMVDYFARFGYGAIVHAAHYKARVEAACIGPVACLPLAAYVPDGIAMPSPIAGSLRVVSIGHVNSNRLAEEIIIATAVLPTLRRRVHYQLVGPVEDDVRRKLIALANHLGVPSPTFTDWVSEDELVDHIGSADVICCLRNPILEGASGSVVLGLASGRPTIVSNHGCYAEIPDDLVFKCRPGMEISDVAVYLDRILKMPHLAADMGRRAASFARSIHNPVRYVDGLLDLMERSIRYLPTTMTGIAVGQILNSVGVTDADPAIERVSNELSDLLDSNQTL